MTTVRGNPDLLLLPAIRQRLKLEGEADDGNGAYWAVMARPGDGLPRIEKSEAHMLGPVPEQIMFANDMVGVLNRVLHHDGAWIVAFTHPHRPVTTLDAFVLYDRFIFLWIDADADPQFTIESSQSLFSDVLLKGPDYWIEEAERHWQTWNLHMRKVLDARALQGATYKRAQGEGAPSATH